MREKHEWDKETTKTRKIRYRSTCRDLQKRNIDLCRMPVPRCFLEKIRIDLEQTRLIISAVNENGKIVKKITVPAGSWIRQKKFRDGILEIILELPL